MTTTNIVGGTVHLNGEPIPALIPLSLVSEYFPGGRIAGLRTRDPLTGRTSPWLPKYTDGTRKVLDLRPESNFGTREYVVAAAASSSSSQSSARASLPSAAAAQEEEPAAASAVAARKDADHQQSIDDNPLPRQEDLPVSSPHGPINNNNNNNAKPAPRTSSYNTRSPSPNIQAAATADVGRRTQTLSYLRNRVPSEAAAHAGLPQGTKIELPTSSSSGNFERNSAAPGSRAGSTRQQQSGNWAPPPAFQQQQQQQTTTAARSLNMLSGAPAKREPSPEMIDAAVKKNQESSLKDSSIRSVGSAGGGAAVLSIHSSPPRPSESSDVTAAPSPERSRNNEPQQPQQQQPQWKRPEPTSIAASSSILDAAPPPPGLASAPTGLPRADNSGHSKQHQQQQEDQSMASSAYRFMTNTFNRMTGRTSTAAAATSSLPPTVTVTAASLGATAQSEQRNNQDDDDDEETEEEKQQRHLHRKQSGSAKHHHSSNSGSNSNGGSGSRRKSFQSKKPNVPHGRRDSKDNPLDNLTPAERKKLRIWNQQRWDALRLLLVGLCVLLGICIAAAERDTWMRCGLRTMTRALRGTAVAGQVPLISDGELAAVVGTHVYIAARAGIFGSCITASINLTEEGRLLNRWDENLRNALRTVREGPKRSEDAAILTSQSTQGWVLSDSPTILTAVGFADALPVYQVCNDDNRDHAECTTHSGDIATFTKFQVILLLTLIGAGLLFVAVVLDLNVFKRCQVKMHKYVLGVSVIFIWSMALAMWSLYAESSNRASINGMTHAECELEANLREALASFAAATITVSENATRFQSMLDVRQADGRTTWNVSETAMLKLMEANLSIVPPRWLAQPVVYLDDCAVAFSAWGWIASWICYTVFASMFLYARIRAHFDDDADGGGFFNPLNMARAVMNNVLGTNVFDVDRPDSDNNANDGNNNREGGGASSPSASGGAELLMRTVAEHGIRMGLDAAVNAVVGNSNPNEPTSNNAANSKNNHRRKQSDGAKSSSSIGTDQAEERALAADCSRADFGARMQHVGGSGAANNDDEDDDAYYQKGSDDDDSNDRGDGGGHYSPSKPQQNRRPRSLSASVANLVAEGARAWMQSKSPRRTNNA